MKLSILLPILAAAEKKQQPINKEDNRSVERQFDASQVTEECSKAVGRFQARSSSDGSQGLVILNHYMFKTINCKHVVHADSGCREIKIRYGTVAVKPDNDFTVCSHDSFRYGWMGTNGLEVTPARCGCFGRVCDFDSTMLGPDVFIVKSNNFTLFFNSDGVNNGSNIVLSWMCAKHTDYYNFTTTTTRGLQKLHQEKLH